MSLIATPRELEQATPLIEEAHAIAEIPAEGEDGVERSRS
jgi:hypothetical protein